MHLCLKSSMETTKVIKGIIEFKENNDRIFHHEFPCFNDFLVKSLRCTILIRHCRVFLDNISNHQAFLDFFDKLSIRIWQVYFYLPNKYREYHRIRNHSIYFQVTFPQTSTAIDIVFKNFRTIWQSRIFSNALKPWFSVYQIL